MIARSRIMLLAALLPALAALAVSVPAQAQSGRITGRVTEAETGTPLPYANVVLVGTSMGGMTLTDGTFTVVGVPVGTYTVKVMMMGYKPEEKTEVRVNAGTPTRVDFQLEEQIVGQTQEIVVEAEQVAAGAVAGAVQWCLDDRVEHDGRREQGDGVYAV